MIIFALPVVRETIIIYIISLSAILFLSHTYRIIFKLSLYNNVNSFLFPALSIIIKKFMTIYTRTMFQVNLKVWNILACIFFWKNNLIYFERKIILFRTFHILKFSIHVVQIHFVENVCMWKHYWKHYCSLKIFHFIPKVKSFNVAHVYIRISF